MKNIQRALDQAGHGNKIKVTCPFNSDVYAPTASSNKPSSGVFRSDINDTMVDIVRFLHDHDSAYVVNIHPLINLISGKNYTNMFDASLDTLIWVLRKSGVPNLRIIVGEVGWPTDGDINAKPTYAKKFYNGFLNKMAKKKGTPLRPGPIDAYLFGLIDEDLKSILPGDFERHWGILTYDGQPKFPMDLSEIRNHTYLTAVEGIAYLPAQWCVFNKKAKDHSNLAGEFDYACSKGDCTALGYKSSCNNLNKEGNISYAFNMYFQMSDQDVKVCDFGGLGKIEYRNASQNGCLFPVQILSTGVRTIVVVARTLFSICFVVLFLV
ncbi:hypothetical protein LUZ60_012389 [Juncus effusus]|nr:hypothetical protein LUZ60_012389 [Juncus effusus]